MTAKRFKLRLSKLGNGMITDTQKRKDLYFDKEFLGATLPKATEWLNALNKENEQLRKEKDKLHQKIFEMRTNIALERTEISKQTYTGKKNEKEYLDAKEFLDDLEKW